MRSIKKRAFGGYHLDQASTRPPLTSEQATSRWQSFGHKSQVIALLLEEQFQICCYSEVRADELGIGHHIEHVENKGQNPLRTFDYSNLAASALSTEDLQTLNRGDAFGGHAAGKQSAVDMLQFVSCHQADCASFFAYVSDGRIVPHDALEAPDKARAQYTIDLLNLNSPFLLTLRQRWWDELDALYSEHMENGWSLRHLVAGELVPHQEELRQFFSLTRQYFGKHAEQALQAHAPELV